MDRLDWKLGGLSNISFAQIGSDGSWGHVERFGHRVLRLGYRFSVSETPVESGANLLLLGGGAMVSQCRPPSTFYGLKSCVGIWAGQKAIHVLDRTIQLLKLLVGFDYVPRV
jgi:hypothetical protein